jgi:hypothetical protein
VTRPRWLAHALPVLARPGGEGGGTTGSARADRPGSAGGPGAVLACARLSGLTGLQQRWVGLEGGGGCSAVQQQQQQSTDDGRCRAPHHHHPASRQRNSLENGHLRHNSACPGSSVVCAALHRPCSAGFASSFLFPRRITNKIAEVKSRHDGHEPMGIHFCVLWLFRPTRASPWLCFKVSLMASYC